MFVNNQTNETCFYNFELYQTNQHTHTPNNYKNSINYCTKYEMEHYDIIIERLAHKQEY